MLIHICLSFHFYFRKVFNNSPDETAYFRMLLNRENITNSAVMIQPSLISYSFNTLPAPALLDVASIAADRILLLDSYFSVVVFHGMTVAQWRNMGYQNQPEHQVCVLFDTIFLSFTYYLGQEVVFMQLQVRHRPQGSRDVSHMFVNFEFFNNRKRVDSFVFLETTGMRTDAS